MRFNSTMPQRHFLTARDGLCQQVADFIIRGAQAGHFDPATMLLVTPTAGATRQIHAALTAAGLNPPTSAQPMQALLPACDELASPVERCLAWAEALQQAPESTRQALFWKKSPQSLAELLKAGRNFNQLCDLLTEGGHAPDTLPLPAHLQGSFEATRWAAVGELYTRYLQQLDAWGRRDPNALRLQMMQHPSPAITHLMVAGVPDLPTAFEGFTRQLEQQGSRTDLLIWNPGNCPPEHFDAWGRPLVTVWQEHPIQINDDQIYVAASAPEEAHFIARQVQPGQTALVSADPRQNTLIASELLALSLQPYLPEGEPLIRCEAAKLALEWTEFQSSQDLRRLRRLLELPACCRALDPAKPISPREALIAIDHLLGKTIASTLEGAWAASPVLPVDAPPRELQSRARIRRLLGTVRALRHCPVMQLLERAYPVQAARSDANQRVMEICRMLEASPAIRNWSRQDALPTQILAQALRSEQIQRPAAAEATTINGWLEAPWLPEERLVLAGMIEGRLPQSLDGDPFLPDSVRPELGLNHNQQRLARDAYLLHSLLAARDSGRITLCCSKFNHDGDPNRPSRLLLRTKLADLPARTRQLTQAGTSSRQRPSRHTGWRWQLPEPLRPVEKISPTQFEAYLACPFRFCLEKVMGYENTPPAAREMDAAVFGSLIHKTLEEFGREAIRDGSRMLNYDEQHIRQRVQQLLQQEALRCFGPQAMPAVQVQLANAASRLHAFARVQAECFRAGWRILDVERKLAAEGGNSLHVGPLRLSGIIDRIEQHSRTGALRIMDYKTFSSKKTPVQTHLGPVSHNWLPAALVELSVGKRQSVKTWKNLQLPLYRRILEHWYPAETGQHAPETAYFVLPSDPNETGIYPFHELDEPLNPEAYPHALNCAEAVAQHIASGVFWPPQPFRDGWDDPFAPLFVNTTPEQCISAATIELLRGGTQ